MAKKVVHLDAVITGGPGTSSGEKLCAKNLRIGKQRDKKNRKYFQT
jgi:hypothetical protein